MAEELNLHFLVGARHLNLTQIFSEALLNVSFEQTIFINQNKNVNLKVMKNSCSG